MQNRYPTQSSSGMGKLSSSSSSSFSAWLESQKNADIEDDSRGDETISLFSQFGAIQDGFANQLSELSGSLADGGPLNAAFRDRFKQSIYLLLISALFAALAVFIGLPTILLRPAKFVVCLTLSTVFAAASVIVMQTPKAYFTSILQDESPKKKLSLIALFASIFFTLYCALFIHKYLYIVFSGCIQGLCLLYYLAIFIPGGSKGLNVLLWTGYQLLSTAMQPCLFVTRRFIRSFVRQFLS